MSTPLVLITIVSMLVAAAATMVAWRATRENARRSAARIAALCEDIHGPGFVLAPPQRDLSGPLVALACAVLVIMTTAGIVSSARSAIAPPSTPGGVPLQLVALSHTLTPEGLLVTGTIRNPDDASRRQDLVVLIFVFDRQGQVLARSQHDAGSGSLDPGQSSTFALTVPSRGVPATFKVSFRQRDAVVPHIDRRPGVEKAPPRAEP